MVFTTFVSKSSCHRPSFFCLFYILLLPRHLSTLVSYSSLPSSSTVSSHIINYFFSFKRTSYPVSPSLLNRVPESVFPLFFSQPNYPLCQTILLSSFLSISKFQKPWLYPFLSSPNSKTVQQYISYIAMQQFLCHLQIHATANTKPFLIMKALFFTAIVMFNSFHVSILPLTYSPSICTT